MSEARQSGRLEVRVTPASARNQITGVRDGVLYVKIAAPPVHGKANKDLVDFLARRLGVKRASISIIKGGSSRHKVIEVAGLDREEIWQKLAI